MFVDFHVEMTPPLFLNTLVLPGTNPQEGEFRERRSVAKKPAQEEVVEGEPEAIMRGDSDFRLHFLANGIRELSCKCLRDQLMAI